MESAVIPVITSQVPLERFSFGFKTKPEAQPRYLVSSSVYLGTVIYVPDCSRGFKTPAKFGAKNPSAPILEIKIQ